MKEHVDILKTIEAQLGEFQNITLTITRDSNGTHYGASVTGLDTATRSYNIRVLPQA